MKSNLTQEQVDAVVSELVETPIEKKALADAVVELDDSVAGSGNPPEELDIQCVKCGEVIESLRFVVKYGRFVHKTCD